jgi:Protein of unknown function (DUF3224)
MTTSASATFTIDGWDEAPYEELADGRKLTRASVKQTFSGDITGAGAVEWLMAYRPDATADYVGLQRITGTLGGKSGTFVLSTAGTFDGAVAAGTWTVLVGSGTDGLTGLTGTGTFSAPSGGEPTVCLDYDL